MVQDKQLYGGKHSRTKLIIANDDKKQNTNHPNK